MPQKRGRYTRMIDHIGFGAFHFARIEARNGAFTGPCANIFRRVQIFQMARRMAGMNLPLASTIEDLSVEPTTGACHNPSSCLGFLTDAV